MGGSVSRRLRSEELDWDDNNNNTIKGVFIVAKGLKEAFFTSISRNQDSIMSRSVECASTG